MDWQTHLKALPQQSSLARLSVAVSRALYLDLQTRFPLDSDQRPFSGQLISAFGDLSYYAQLSGLHEPVLARNQPFVLGVAQAVFNEAGAVDPQRIKAVMHELKQHAFCLEPFSYYESQARQHVLAILERLSHADGSLSKAIMSFSPPSNHRLAEQRVRETLGLPPRAQITVRDARVAVLSMLLSYFRQNVGSCFATAPGIVLQRYSPELLVRDMQSLFDRGRLERYFAGEGMEVPFSQSVGVGDFKRVLSAPVKETQALLRRFAQSPALDAALLAAGILVDRSREQREQQVVFWLMTPVRDHLSKQGAQPLFTIEQLITWIAMQAHGVTQEALQRYKERPAPLVHNGMLVRTLNDDKGAACDDCLSAIDTMVSSFKRFGENPLLKAWEYTVASMTDHQSAFTNTNLYHSLGVDSKQPNGIGHILRLSIQTLLDRFNEEVKVGQRDYQHLGMQANSLRMRLNTVPSDSRFTMELEYNKLMSSMNELEYRVQMANRQAHYLSNLFSRLLECYFDWFADYFQEIYDPDLHSQKVGQYDDAPAGFRLYFKHGRSDSSQWQAIHNEKEFLDVLREFFRSTESLLLAQEPDEARDIIHPLVTEILQHLQKPDFIHSAKERLKRSRFVDEGAEDVRTPWAYVSGGYVDKLLGAYLKLDGLPQTKRMAVANPVKLFSALVEVVRALPSAEGRIEHPGFSMERVICSPTHAFILQPHREPFRACWADGVDPSAWLDQHLLTPSHRFFNSLKLNKAMQHYLVEQMVQQGAPAELLSLTTKASLAPQHFGQRVLQPFAKPARASLSHLLASVCYQQLPLFRWSDVPEAAERIAHHLDVRHTDWRSIIRALLERLPEQRYIGSEMLQALVLLGMMLVEGKLFSERDWQTDVAEAARELDYAPPSPLLFADSNWFNYEFGLALNPVTGQLDLWQCNGLGHIARPWSIAWGKPWLFFVG